jgi:hypothetical protein
MGDDPRPWVMSSRDQRLGRVKFITHGRHKLPGLTLDPSLDIEQPPTRGIRFCRFAWRKRGDDRVISL